MTYRRLPANTPALLRKAGLTVVEVDGWQTRGRPADKGGFNPKGVLCHHTATGPKTSNAAVVNLLVKGRSDLPGPLAQFGLARNGTVYLIASGRANHAGKAKASGNMPSGDGNELYVGIEAFNDGVGEPWSALQMSAYATLAAVLSKEITHNTAQSVRGHKETSTTGKVDPKFDMGAFRKTVEARLNSASALVRPKATPAWMNKFIHLDPSGYMNYHHAVMNMKPGDRIDIDGHASAGGTGFALHWPTVGQNHLHDPKGLIKPTRRIDSLTNAEIKRLRGPNGEQVFGIMHLLREVHARGGSAEVELKIVFSGQEVKRWLANADVKALNAAGKLQFKTLAQYNGAILRLSPAHHAGGTTILSFSKYDGPGIVKARAWPVVDYVRGTPKWR